MGTCNKNQLSPSTFRNAFKATQQVIMRNLNKLFLILFVVNIWVAKSEDILDGIINVERIVSPSVANKSGIMNSIINSSNNVPYDNSNFHMQNINDNDDEPYKLNKLFRQSNSRTEA